MDGRFTAITGVSAAMDAAGAADDYRLIGGVTVMLHIGRLGHGKVFGNRWERRIDERRVAAVDLLVPADRMRARGTVTVGKVVTTEVPGLAEALQRPGVTIDAELRLTDGARLDTTVVPTRRSRDARPEDPRAVGSQRTP